MKIVHVENGSWKIIRVSNFDHEDWRGNQRVVAERIALRREADLLCAALNAAEHENSDDAFEVVPQEQALREDWQP